MGSTINQRHSETNGGHHHNNQNSHRKGPCITFSENIKAIIRNLNSSVNSNLSK